jgi:dihydrofolate reductase
MRKIIISTMITLDGVMEAPQNWSFSYWNDEIASYAHEQLFTSDALLTGRETYVGFAEAWSARAGADDFADRINAMLKLVASTTLQASDLTWTNSTLIKGDTAAELARLKQQPGQNILKYGGGKLMYTLIEHGLLDELRLLVFPTVVGTGERIFKEGNPVKLKLLDSKTFSTGVVALHYQPEKA